MASKIIVVDFDDTLFFTNECSRAACMEVLGKPLPKALVRKLKPRSLKHKVYDLAVSKYGHLARPNTKLIRILSKSDRADVVVLTARLARARRHTMMLLNKHGVRYSRVIFRPNRLVDSKDEEWKLGKLNGFARKYKEIDVYEDKIDNINCFKRGLKHGGKSRFVLVEADGRHREVV